MRTRVKQNYSMGRLFYAFCRYTVQLPSFPLYSVNPQFQKTRLTASLWIHSNVLRLKALMGLLIFIENQTEDEKIVSHSNTNIFTSLCATGQKFDSHWQPLRRQNSYLPTRASKFWAYILRCRLHAMCELSCKHFQTQYHKSPKQCILSEKQKYNEFLFLKTELHKRENGWTTASSCELVEPDSSYR